MSPFLLAAAVPGGGANIAPGWGLFLAILLVFLNGFFVAAEFAFVTVDRSQVDRAADEGDTAAQGLQTALRSLSTQLSAAQVGITLTNLGIGFLAEPAIAEIIDGPLASAGVPDGAVTPIAVGIGGAMNRNTPYVPRK